MPELFERRGEDICIAIEWPGSTKATWVNFDKWIQTKIYVEFRGQLMTVADVLRAASDAFPTQVC